MLFTLSFNDIKLWFKKLRTLQIIAFLLALGLLLMPYSNWIHIFPSDNIKEWTKYLPMNLERHYTGFQIIGLLTWFPILFAACILIPIYDKLLLLLMLLFGILIYFEALQFINELRDSAPLKPYINDYLINYLIAYQLLSAFYLYLTTCASLFVYSIYILIIKN